MEITVYPLAWAQLHLRGVPVLVHVVIASVGGRLSYSPGQGLTSSFPPESSGPWAVSTPEKKGPDRGPKETLLDPRSLQLPKERHFRTFLLGLGARVPQVPLTQGPLSSGRPTVCPQPAAIRPPALLLCHLG